MIQAPTAPAKAWLTMVATKIAQMMGWAAEAGGEQEREQLGLVAHFGQRHDGSRDQEGLHVRFSGRQGDD